MSNSQVTPLTKSGPHVRQYKKTAGKLAVNIIEC